MTWPSAAAAHVSSSQYAHLTGRGFFPQLISGPFGHGLHLAFYVAAVLCLLAAVFSWLRGPSTAKVGRTPLEETEQGLRRSGEVAMQEAGARRPAGVAARHSGRLSAVPPTWYGVVTPM